MDQTIDKLDQLAAKLDRPRADVVAEASDDYVAREDWQIAEIQAGLTEAERGDFVSDDEVADVLRTYLNLTGDACGCATKVAP